MTSLADTTPNYALRQTIRTLEAEVARLSSGFHESCFARIEALEAKLRAEQKRHTAGIYRLSNERDAARAKVEKLRSLLQNWIAGAEEPHYAVLRAASRSALSAGESK